MGAWRWRQLADASLTPFDRREIRNYMKDTEIALGAGIKRMADKEIRREAETAKVAKKRLDFRIIRLDF